MKLSCRSLLGAIPALALIMLLPLCAPAATLLDGFNIHNLGSVSITGSVYAVAVQRDAKILVGGSFIATGGSPVVTRRNLARLNPDGTLDTAFAPPLLDQPVHAIALQPDLATPANPDLVIIGGSFTSVGGTTRKGLARLTGATGAPDDFNPVDELAPPVTVKAITLLPGGGDLLIGGVFTEIEPGIPSRNLAGVSAPVAGSGGLNWRYSGGLSNDAGNVEVDAILLQDGMVVVGGEFATPWSFNIARFRVADGAYDPGFAPPSPGGAVRSLALQVDGKILLGGDFTAGALGRDYLARINADGTLDGFDPGFDTAPGNAVTSLIVQPDGKILAAGRFTIGPAATLRTNLVRLNIAGTLDSVRFPQPDALLRAIALQGDAKIVAGGDFTAMGAAPRTALARFYPHGGLDEDAYAISDGGMGLRLVQHPDGTSTLGGLFESIDGVPRSHIARLREDWSLDPAFAPNLDIDSWIYSLSARSDGGVLVGGDFATVNGVPQKMTVQVGPTGVPGPAAFNGGMNLSLGAWGAVRSMAQVADGTLTEDGMIYLGGGLGGPEPAFHYLSRFRANGERDPGFVPDHGVDDEVNAIAVQPDNMLLVATYSGKLLRLTPGGALDPAWNAGEPLDVSDRVSSVEAMYLQRDGRVIVAGVEDFSTLTSRMFRLNSDGSIDPGFNVEATYSSPDYSSMILGFAPQANGSIVISGLFDGLKDSYGNTAVREMVARIRPDGSLDPSFDLGLSYDRALVSPVGLVESVSLQPDGKLVLLGEFAGLDGRAKLARVSNGTASEELLVSADGKKVTWLRQGSSPDLWQVKFEHCVDPDAAVPVWTHLGYAQRIEGGWELDVDLKAMGSNVNRWVRARGIAAWERGNGGSLLESVRLYHLKKTVVTVTAQPGGKNYGGPEPALTYTFSPPLSPGDSFDGVLKRTAGEDAGDYPIVQGTLSLPANYQIVFAGATFIIRKAPLVIRADDKSRAAGAPDPELTASFTGLTSFDTPASLGGVPLLTSTANATSAPGSYPIHAAPGSITNVNYAYSFADGTLTVTGKKPQAIAFGPLADRIYGDPPFAPGGTSSSGLPVTYASSNPGVATVVNGEIVITGAGSSSITASQGGDATYGAATDVSVPFTVHKATLRVTADDKFRAYLTSNPELTASCRGFVNGEERWVLSGAPALSTPATLASSVGNYPILVAPGTLSARNYSFLPVNGTLGVFKSCQEINFPPIPERTFGDPPFQLVASACSGLTLGFTSSNPAVAQVSGNVVTITGAGSVVITASQPGDGSLESAPQRSQTLIVHKSGQVLSFSSLARKVVGDPPFDLEATATSGLLVSYLSSDPAVAVVSGTSVTITGAGTTVIRAVQPGDGNYHSALPVSQALNVAEEGSAPLVSLSTVSSGSVTSNPVLNLMGAASDASGIASLTVHGTDRTADAALFSSAVPLAGGVNAIRVAARDRAGNLTTQTVTVTLDPLAPALRVATPADNSVTDVPSCAVSGSAPDGSAVTLRVNDDPPQLLQVQGGTFAGAGFLTEGVNTIELAAELSGRSSRVKRSVTLSPGGHPLAITDPAQDIRTEEAAITIRGTTVAGLAGGVVIEVDGAAFYPDVSTGTFQQQVALNRIGEIRITARGAGSGGQTSVAHRNVVRVERISGDLSGNGSVDIEDASLMLMISLGLEPATAGALAHGDVAPLVDGAPQPDGVIDVGDLLVLLRKIVGLVQF